MSKSPILTMAAVAICATGSAFAAPADDAITACRSAIEAEQGDEVVTKLSKIKPRGNNYEVWFNVKAAAGMQRTYCYLKRGQVQQVVTEEGRWKGRNPRRPEGVDLS